MIVMMFSVMPMEFMLSVFSVTPMEWMISVPTMVPMEWMISVFTMVVPMKFSSMVPMIRMIAVVPIIVWVVPTVRMGFMLIMMTDPYRRRTRSHESIPFLLLVIFVQTTCNPGDGYEGECPK